MTQGSWRLAWTSRPARPRAVVLVLHGGKERSQRPARWRQTAVLRMVPFARAVARAGRGELAVARLRYSVRGWNGQDASPVADTRAALTALRQRYPRVPIGLLGHSMGGRTALFLADEPDVEALVALAPWVERHDRPRGGPTLRALLLHGTRDRITSVHATRWMADQLAARGVEVTWRPLPGEGHALLRHAPRIHKAAADFLVRGLGASAGGDGEDVGRPRCGVPDRT